MVNQDSLLRNLPDYFRLELSQSALELVVALQESFQRFSSSELLEAASPSVLGTSRRRLVEDLRLAGFESDTLNETEQVLFLGMRHQLLAEAHSLTGVGRLADVYFPGASVQRGRPYPRTSLQRHGRLRLADRQERRTVVSVQLKAPPPPARVAEFIKNCNRLLPITARVEVRFDDPGFVAPPVWRLTGRTRGGRLACRISPN